MPRLPAAVPRFLVVAIAFGIAPLHATAQPIDEEAAFALAKKGTCLKCHAIAKRKKAPSYTEIARKYSGKPDAESALYKHINGKPVVKLEDGDEPHAAPPTKDDAELYNLIRWILTRTPDSAQ